jgi:hypothetical protein
MKPIYLLAASALALTAAACGPKVPAARAALECPMKQGELTRTSASPDGKACTYASEGGTEVTLQLVSTAGGVDPALTTIENNLLAARGQPAAAKPGQTPAEPAEAPAVAADGAAARAAKEAAADTKGLNIDGQIDGKHVDSVHVEMKDGKTTIKEGDGSVTRVDLPGIHIVADDEKDSANVKLGPVMINAGDDNAQIRIRRDVRLRGEAFNPEKRGMRATFIYTGDDLAGGYRYVGYEAGGPKRGPITVAVVKSKAEGPDDSGLHSAVKRLVRMNGGV